MNERRAYYIHHNFPIYDFFSLETRDLFLNTFKVYFSVEESAELLRKRIGKRPEFDVHEAFQTIDSDNDGFISIEEIK